MSTEPQANFTPRCQAVINESKKLCKKLRHDSVEPIHLFSCILSNQFSVIPDLLATYNINIEEAITCVSAHLTKLKTVDRDKNFNLRFSTSCKEVIFSAIEISEQLLHPYVGLEHLLISLLEQKDNAIIINFLFGLFRISKILLNLNSIHKVKMDIKKCKLISLYENNFPHIEIMYKNKGG